MRSFTRASISAVSSTVEPREMLTRMPSGPRPSSTRALIMPLVLSPPARVTIRNSERRGQLDEVGDEGVGQIGALVDVEIGHVAVEAGEAFGDGRSDAAHADDADLLAADTGHEIHVGLAPSCRHAHRYRRAGSGGRRPAAARCPCRRHPPSGHRAYWSPGCPWSWHSRDRSRRRRRRSRRRSRASAACS